MMRKAVTVAATVLAVTIAMQVPALAGPQSYSFYVLHQRTIALTAQYWNPILTHVSAKSGVPLDLKLAKPATVATSLRRNKSEDMVITVTDSVWWAKPARLKSIIAR